MRKIDRPAHRGPETVPGKVLIVGVCFGAYRFQLGSAALCRYFFRFAVRNVNVEIPD